MVSSFPSSSLAGFSLDISAGASLLNLIIGLAMSAETGSAAPVERGAVPDYTTSEAGNPFVEGWYADPDTAIYEGLYWVYPTSSLPYDQQTYLDAFSSPDLVHWTKHPNVLTAANVSWATRAIWAPAPVARNGKYYLYFGANDIQEGEPERGLVGGIGVAVADRPEGPYVDAIGKPLIGEYHNGAQPIDQDVFVDDADGQAYIYYGGHSHANVAKLNADMVSLGTFDDGTQFREITPENYVEGSQMFKRGGAYYFMWSEGGWTGPDYSVSYAVADSPLGPFVRRARVLQQDPAVARGSGHNAVLRVPGSDVWYIVYHRRPLAEADGNHRVLAYDRMYFDGDGAIRPVKMLVKDNFADGRMFNWKTYGGRWAVAGRRLAVAAADADARAFLDTNFSSLVFDATVAVAEGTGDAGLVFRATNLSAGADGFRGYYAGISPAGTVALGKSDAGTWTLLQEASLDIAAAAEYNLRVTAVGSEISVFVNDLAQAKITATDESFASGANGVQARNSGARFGSVSVAEA
ncbi:carbohydrate-binding module family 66 protein [Durotheca rogersii]|uniref:carbohydrate-binding module family 66 protein n=1 Tax=Durotheca rogersii TaxID=419775 RepID=UPI00222052C3|nr:carbohydrate-binding module family 66 protein [Durotheca rogersii]KAI5866541.1 carbohydrate-binding module family 66 protein [Durotheca rogersii]